MVGPMILAGAVKAVASFLDGASVEVIGLNGRGSYPHESACAVAVSVHLGHARDVERVADLFGLSQPEVATRSLYSCEGDWLPPLHAQVAVHVSIFGPPPVLVGVGVNQDASCGEELS